MKSYGVNATNKMDVTNDTITVSPETKRYFRCLNTAG